MLRGRAYGCWWFWKNGWNKTRSNANERFVCCQLVRMSANKPLRVCHVVASINRNTGGPAITSVRLAQAQAQLGVQTTLMTVDYSEHGAQVPAEGIELITLPNSQLTRRFRGYNPP